LRYTFEQLLIGQVSDLGSFAQAPAHGVHTGAFTPRAR
jgi:hypothetical protein